MGELSSRFRVVAARPAAARGLRGPPAPSVHPGLAGRGDRGVLPRGGGGAAAAGRPRHRRGDRAQGGHHAAGCIRPGWRCCPTGCTAATSSRASAPPGGWRAAPPLCPEWTGRWPVEPRWCSARRWASACPPSATRPPATWSATRSPTSPATATARGRGPSSRVAGRAEPQRQLLDAYPRIDLPVLLLWADEDPAHPLIGAYEALDLLPNAQLRTLPATGFLMAYDDPVGVARELISFFG